MVHSVAALVMLRWRNASISGHQASTVSASVCTSGAVVFARQW